MIASRTRIGFVSTNTGLTDANADILRRNMERRLGRKLDPGWQAHHIVPSTHTRAKAARDILDYHHVDINDAVNGIEAAGSGVASHIPGPRHHGEGLHSHAMIDYVTARLEAVGMTGPPNPDAVRRIIRDIRTKIANGEIGGFIGR